MPPGSGDTRARLISTLRSVANETLCDARIGDLLAEAEQDQGALSPWQAANLREMLRQWRQVTAVPVALQNEIAALAGPTESAWDKARRTDDFRCFAGPFRAYLALQIEVSRIRGAALGLDPYDALLDEHEPGLRTSVIDPLFDDLTQFLPDLLHEIDASQARTEPPLPLDGPFPEDRQIALSRLLAARLGFDFEQGRLDQSAHPYTSIVPGDIRITTRFRADNVREGIMATIHETGHALYERGLPEEWRFQPVGLARGGALHESQALLFEMVAGRSAPFLAYLSGQLRRCFGRTGAAWSDDNIVRTYRRIEPSACRVDANEISYPLHIILRYRIEQQLIAGSLDVDDLPEAWNMASRELLGVTPRSDAMGCLQDPHWVIGYIGYFPVYALGALIAAQMFAAAQRGEPGLMDALGEGDVRPLADWLRGHVHRLASFPATGPEIIAMATGEDLSTRAFKDLLTMRYLGAPS